MERSDGSLQRSIRLPGTIGEDRVAARFGKGVLTATLPQRSYPPRLKGEAEP